MSNNLYYGEIAAKISGVLHQNPDHLMRINHMMSDQSRVEDDTLYTLCADAARVFDKIEDLSGEHYINWHVALDNFSNEMLDCLLSGTKPSIVDMVSMSAQSIENSK